MYAVLSHNGEISLVFTPSAAIASLQRNSLTEERSTARPSPNLKITIKKFFPNLIYFAHLE